MIVFLLSTCHSVEVFGRSKILILKRAQEKMPCRVRQRFVISYKALPFPTQHCRFLDNLNQNV
jgi:hypothetical protein